VILSGFEFTPGVVAAFLSAGVSVTRLYSTFSQANSFKLLSKKLQSIKAVEPGKIPTDSVGREELVFQLLENGEFIVAGLKQKLTQRFLFAIYAILVFSIAISLDFTNATEFRGIEIHDLYLFFAQITVAFISNSKAILKDIEKEFLSNLSVLHTRFYRLYVRAAMFEFNEQMKHLNFLDKDFNEEKQERDAITRVLVQTSRSPNLIEGAQSDQKSLNSGPTRL